MIISCRLSAAKENRPCRIGALPLTRRLLEWSFSGNRPVAAHVNFTLSPNSSSRGKLIMSVSSFAADGQTNYFSRLKGVMSQSKVDALTELYSPFLQVGIENPMQKPTALCYFPISRPILSHRLSEKCVAKCSEYAHWIGLFLSFHLCWLLGPFVHGRLRIMKTSEDTFGHDITPLKVSKFICQASNWQSRKSMPKWLLPTKFFHRFNRPRARSLEAPKGLNGHHLAAGPESLHGECLFSD